MPRLVKLALAVIAGLFVPAMASAQGAALSGQVITPFSTPAQNVPVRVCQITAIGTPCSTSGVTLYANYTLTTPISNPTSTDSNGNYSFFVTPGTYILQVTAAAGTTYAYFASAATGSSSASLLGPANSGWYNSATNVTTAITLGAGGVICTDAVSGFPSVCTTLPSGLDYPSPQITNGSISGTTINNATLGLTTPAAAKVTSLIDTGISASTSPICPNGAGGAFTTSGCAGGGGSGSVTSVGLALPSSVFNISGSPVTTTGTLAGAFVNQSANTVFAGPASGSAASPAFRALTSSDLPPAASTCTSIIFSTTPTFAYTTPCLALTMTANVTASTATSFTAGNTYLLFLVQDATGNRTFTPPSVFRNWPTDINRAANGTTLCQFSAYTDGNLYIERCSWI